MIPLLLAFAAQTSLGGTAGFAISERLETPASRATWSDEFSGSKVDPAKWGFDRSRNKLGWYNGEQQYYGPRAAKVSGGLLTIEASRDPALRTAPDFGGQKFGSAKLSTQGRARWTYGFVEVRAKLPCGGGTWPAIWMMPEAKQRWPDGGEIDIMEQVSSEPNVIHGTLHSAKFVHTKGTQRGASLSVPTSCSAFHRYQMRWTAEAITVGVDGQAFFRVRNTAPLDRGAWPFDRPFHLILNLALGGSWPGPVDEQALPQRMQVDYVRVWSERAGR